MLAFVGVGALALSCQQGNNKKDSVDQKDSIEALPQKDTIKKDSVVEKPISDTVKKKSNKPQNQPSPTITKYGVPQNFQTKYGVPIAD